jgi:hypothetical protein
MSYEGSVSYSRLAVFESCHEKYRLTYLNKEAGRPYISKYECLEEALIKGTLSHSVVEFILQGNTKDDSIELAIRPWLETICNVDTDSSIKNSVNIEQVVTYAKECGKLLMRCSEAYVETDKIRKKDGGIYKDPFHQLYGSKEFKETYNDLGLYKLRTEIDNNAVLSNNSFRRFSLANIAAQAASYGYIFNLPECVQNVKSIEYDTSENKVGFNDNRLYWNGRIDTEYETWEGAVIINDHKTEKEKRRPEDVFFDLQLNSYAHIRYEQTDKLPDYIAITHLATNSLIAANTNAKVVNLCMDHLEGIQHEINLQVKDKGVNKEWSKKWPGKYGSPCFRRNWQSGALDSVCPFLAKCHPEYYECIKDEVDEFFGVNGQVH